MISFKKLVVGLAAAAACVAAQSAVVIDMFDGNPIQSVTDNTRTASAFDPITGVGTGVWATGGVEANAASVIGGQRDMYIEWTVDSLGNGAAVPTARPTISVANGFLTINNGSGVGGAAALRWDGAKVASTGDSGIAMGLSPLALSPADFFKLDIIDSDHVFGLDLYMFTSTTTYSKVSVGGQVHTMPISQLIPIGAFGDCDNSVSGGITTCVNGGVTSLIDGTGVDFSNVGALMAVVNFTGATSLSLDITLNAASVVPEPGSIALVGAALLGLGATRRRKAL